MAADLTGIENTTSVNDALEQLAKNNRLVIFGEKHDISANNSMECDAIAATRRVHPDAKIALFIELPPEELEFTMDSEGHQSSIGQESVDAFLKDGTKKAGWGSIETIIEEARANNISVYLVDSFKDREIISAAQKSGPAENENQALRDTISSRNQLMADRMAAIMSGDAEAAAQYGYVYDVPEGGFDRAISINGMAHMAYSRDMDELLEKKMSGNIAVVELHDTNELHDVDIAPTHSRLAKSHLERKVTYSPLTDELPTRAAMRDYYEERLRYDDAPDISINVNRDAERRAFNVTMLLDDVAKVARHDPSRHKTSPDTIAYYMDSAGEGVADTHKEVGDIFQSTPKEEFSFKALDYFRDMEESDPRRLWKYDVALQDAVMRSPDGQKIDQMWPVFGAHELVSNLADLARDNPYNPYVHDRIRDYAENLLNEPGMKGNRVAAAINDLYAKEGRNEAVFESKAEEILEAASLQAPQEFDDYSQAMRNALAKTHGMRGLLPDMYMQDVDTIPTVSNAPLTPSGDTRGK